MQGFINFIREQGVMGLAIGFMLGGSVQKVVASLVNDIINPFISAFVGGKGRLESLKFVVNGNDVLWGHFLTVVLDFSIVAFVVYYIFKGLKLDKIDKKKQ